MNQLLIGIGLNQRSKMFESRSLPTGFHIRPASLDDLPGIADLMNACDIADGDQPGNTPEELLVELNRTGFNPEVDAWVVERAEGDLVVGYGEEAVKKAIDLSKGTGESVLKNATLKPYIDNFKSNVIVSMVFEFPAEARKVQDGGMFKIDVSKAEAIVGSIDYEANVLNGVLELISKNEQANKDLVNTLNGLKGMGAMAGPEVAELVNNINLAASADKISLTFSISDELVEKLKNKMAEKTKGIVAPPTE